jgi:hypothetical protein
MLSAALFGIGLISFVLFIQWLAGNTKLQRRPKRDKKNVVRSRDKR